CHRHRDRRRQCRRFRSHGCRRPQGHSEGLCGGRHMTASSQTRPQLGTSEIPERPEAWVKHENLAPEWSAVGARHVIELLHAACIEDPERPAIIMEGGAAMTRREFLHRSQCFAGYLSTQVHPGDRIVLMLDNRIEFMIALFGIIANRCTMVSIAPTAMEHDGVHIV